MSVKQDGQRRYVELEFDVPGTPEQVWQAIATGPGISAWFVPTDMEERVGGAIQFHLGSGMDSSGVVTGLEPPTRFAYEEREWSNKAPPLATECFVETLTGDTCRVRIVHSLFTDSSDWDSEMESFEQGWPPFFEILRLYLTQFKGQRCASARMVRGTTLSQAEAWNKLRSALGVVDARSGAKFESAHGAPRLAGKILRVGGGRHDGEVLIQLERPAPGLALVGAYGWNAAVHGGMNVYLYGDNAAAALQREEPEWEAWLNAQLPASSSP